MQLVVGQIRELATGDAKGVVELIIGIVHLVDTHHGFQATLVEGLVVGYKGQTLDEWLYLCPDLGEDRSIVGVLTAEAVNL